MTIRSGKGDYGFTDLFYRKGISKDRPEILAIGDMDELNAYLGLARAKIRRRADKETIERMQRMISVVSSEIALGPERKEKNGGILDTKDVEWVESVICELEGRKKPDKCFYMPGETELSAILSIARTIARRAERSVVGLLCDNRKSNRNILCYLNCISDVLFLLARKYSRPAGKKKPGGKRRTGKKNRLKDKAGKR